MLMSIVMAGLILFLLAMVFSLIHGVVTLVLGRFSCGSGKADAEHHALMEMLDRLRAESAIPNLRLRKLRRLERDAEIEWMIEENLAEIREARLLGREERLPHR